ncbi:hypothetical protein DFP72DRAFT_845447 [Ephemerocybe angulata]|uniref:Uncharacterized protein n=1 Tax=Ephemerocybe angulata TaxID=980116 RepID=A0A8H6I5U8_9AGAR|nr:hypothetical protein DFP72DRAFT_845447 [Tulosesus angulatus]
MAGSIGQGATIRFHKACKLNLAQVLRGDLVSIDIKRTLPGRFSFNCSHPPDVIPQSALLQNMGDVVGPPPPFVRVRAASSDRVLATSPYKYNDSTTITFCHDGSGRGSRVHKAGRREPEQGCVKILRSTVQRLTTRGNSEKQICKGLELGKGRPGLCGASRTIQVSPSPLPGNKEKRGARRQEEAGVNTETCCAVTPPGRRCQCRDEACCVWTRQEDVGEVDYSKHPEAKSRVAANYCAPEIRWEVRENRWRSSLDERGILGHNSRRHLPVVDSSSQRHSKPPVLGRPTTMSEVETRDARKLWRDLQGLGTSMHHIDLPTSITAHIQHTGSRQTQGGRWGAGGSRVWHIHSEMPYLTSVKGGRLLGWIGTGELSPEMLTKQLKLLTSRDNTTFDF